MLASDRPAPSARPRDIDYIRVAEPAPVVLAYGIGVDSTALLVELESRGTPPDLVITGDPGIEKPETYVYQEMMAAWLAKRKADLRAELISTSYAMSRPASWDLPCDRP